MQTMAQGWLKVKLMASSGSSRFFFNCVGEKSGYMYVDEMQRDSRWVTPYGVQLLGFWASATQVPTCTYLKRHMRASGVSGIVHGA